MAVVAVLFAILFPLFYYFTRKEERYPKLNRLRQFWARTSSLLCGIRYHYTSESQLDWSKPYILCANHTSNLDATAMTLISSGNYAFLGKTELLKNPVMRVFFKTIDIPVDRSSRMASYRAFKRAAEYIQKGMSLIIFAEGKIGNEYPPVLHSFKDGPFRLAIEHKIPIVPVSILNLWEILWDDGAKYGSKPGVAHIHIHAPIDTTTMDVAQADELKAQVYEIILNKIPYAGYQGNGATDRTISPAQL